MTCRPILAGGNVYIDYMYILFSINKALYLYNYIYISLFMLYEIFPEIRKGYDCMDNQPSLSHLVWHSLKHQHHVMLLGWSNEDLDWNLLSIMNSLFKLNTTNSINIICQYFHFSSYQVLWRSHNWRCDV